MASQSQLMSVNWNAASEGHEPNAETLLQIIHDSTFITSHALASQWLPRKTTSS
ncbi:hypothetical protein CY34DRAFT_796938 [Suillus luteus UH-Slu-Lm8-n1]|uniref:Uncharacterized protein n=1 Tax=Suillus luteus UH-Slu-Lm8-n1 TaxID=930992 RepID=A0A0D0B670_9AGAM|nr:hypothetical protein CY34DRAFT_796938 [Suillus luteus UH-Slu-Lm8-n1]